MSASAPHRQRSLKDRIHQGISNLSWQGKPHEKSTTSFMSYTNPTNETAKPFILTARGKPHGKSSTSFTSYTNPTNETAKPFILTASDNRSLSLDTHGYVNPLDWEIPSFQDSELKLTVSPIISATENRPKSLYSAPGTVTGDAGLKSPPEEPKPTTEKKMVTRSITQPEGTIQFTVAASDTLEGIAARFYTTPSELSKLNKLSSRLIFPGQVIYVPRKDAPEDNSCATPPSTPTDKEAAPVSKALNQDRKLSDPQPMSKPGHVERIVSPVGGTEALTKKSTSPTLSQEEEERRLDEECHKKFLKIMVKHITDGQGIVDGVLLVTPNALMFDPNVSDALVMEHGTEKYSVTCPMNMVANAALYKDISLMRLKHCNEAASEAAIDKSSEVYHRAKNPKFSSPKKDNLASIEDDDVFSESTINKSPAEATPLNDAQNKDSTISAESKPLPKPSDNLHFENILGTEPTKLSEEESSGNQSEQASQRTDDKMDDIKTTVSEVSDIEKQTISEFDPVLIGSSPKTIPPMSDDKRNWYSQLSEISHLPAQIDFSMFRNQKSASTSEGTDLLLSTSYSDSTEHSSTDSHKARLLKRLSQPVSWIESFASGSVDSAAEITASAQSTLSKILPHPFSSSSEKDDTPPSSVHSYASRTFSTSPHCFVDFSSGLFLEEDLDKVKNVGELSSIGQSKSGSYEKPSAIFADKSAFLESTDSVDSAESVGRLFLNAEATGAHNASNKVQIENMVEDKPDLFTNIEKLIPKPASSFRDPPLYLCLLMGHPSKALQSDDGRNLPKHGLMSYGQKCIKPEYWFCIPLNKVEELYNFFNMWAPGVYGDPSKIDFKVKGYKLLETDEELSDDENSGILWKRSKSKKSRNASSPRLVGSLFKMVEERFVPQSPFEVVCIEELQHQMSLDVELPLPDMVGKSEIMDDDHRRKISNELPARAEGYPWHLLYSNSEHGFSLKTMYREMSKYECPILLVVMDTKDAVFGAMMPCILKFSEHFYGTGESFLFTFCPEFKCFNWTGENNYFIKGAPDSLAIGAGDGLFGLWFDEDLYQGRSHKCITYNNDTLSSNEDFIIKSIEAWGFM